MAHFASDVLPLLCLNSVIHGGSWEQHVGCLQTEAAAAAAGRWDSSAEQKAADRQSSRRTSEGKPEDIFSVNH